jgi:hypothetical protein
MAGVYDLIGSHMDGAARRSPQSATMCIKYMQLVQLAHVLIDENKCEK